MGLSVSIAGAIVISTIMFVVFSVPNIANSIFLLGDSSLESSMLQKTISQTKISLEDLDVQVNSPNVNFTVINEGQEKLWDFEKFNVIITYDDASGRPTEQLFYDGDCLGVPPTTGTWCIEIITNDVKDPNIVNSGESARIFTRVNQDLITLNTIVSFNTNNGASAIIPTTNISGVATGVDPPVACQSGFYGRTFIDTDTGITYVCDPTRDKWLSYETITLFGDESGSCGTLGNPNTNNNCNVDWGNGLGPDTNTDLGLYIPYDITITSYGFSEDNDACAAGLGVDVEIWSTGSNVDDNNFALEQELATGLTGQAHNANDLNIDIDGDQYILWGIENLCLQAIDDFNINFSFKWRHDNP